MEQKICDPKGGWIDAKVTLPPNGILVLIRERVGNIKTHSVIQLEDLLEHLQTIDSDDHIVEWTTIPGTSSPCGTIDEGWIDAERLLARPKFDICPNAYDEFTYPDADFIFCDSEEYDWWRPNWPTPKNIDKSGADLPTRPPYRRIDLYWEMMKRSGIDQDKFKNCYISVSGNEISFISLGIVLSKLDLDTGTLIFLDRKQFFEPIDKVEQRFVVKKFENRIDHWVYYIKDLEDPDWVGDCVYATEELAQAEADKLNIDSHKIKEHPGC